EWRALIALGYYTGGRLMDLARLTWAAIDRQKQAITFQQKKTGGVVVIPIHPELARYLDTLKPGIGRAPLLPKLSAKSGTGKSGLSNSFRKIMDVAGIEPGVARERVGVAGRNVSKFSFHSLRHSFTRQAREESAPKVQAALCVFRGASRLRRVATRFCNHR
ncbi:MAG: tyrosine-type recombinase/integrase, partial [Verrucomicrobia bacterium]|nr:tyrosine-type recombinase/integrase [Verrucomicrobiota bacterium]